MSLQTRLLGIGLFFVMVALASGCSRVSVPLLVNPTPTQLPTQVPLPRASRLRSRRQRSISYHLVTTPKRLSCSKILSWWSPKVMSTER